MILEETKICTKCSISKTLNEFYLIKVKEKDKVYLYRMGKCKKCFNKYRKRKRSPNDTTEKRTQKSRCWRLLNPEKAKICLLKSSRKNNIKNKEQLTDRYIKHSLTSKFLNIKHSDIPQNLVILKRKQLLLTRKLKENG